MIQKTVKELIDEAIRNNSKKIDLSERGLITLPASLYEIKDLEILILRDNPISDLAQIKMFKDCLVKLDVSNTDINDISCLGNFYKLKELDFSETETENLSALCNLTLLQKIIANGTKFKDLRQIVNLLENNDLDIRVDNDYYSSGIFVKDCCLEPVTVDFLKKYTSKVELIDFLKSVKNSKFCDVIQQRIFFIGQPNVGKTTLAKRLNKIEYHNKGTENSTKGIDFVSFEISDENNLPKKLRIWDFGGQDIYKLTHRIFLTPNSLYVLVDTNRNDDFVDVDYIPYSYWLPTLKRYGENSKLVILVNEFNELKKDLEEESITEYFKDEIEFVTCNVITSKNLIKVKDAVKKQLSKLPVFFSRIPAHWQDAVKDILSVYEDVKFVGRQKFKIDCASFGISSDEFDFFLRYLKYQGIIMYFPKENLKNSIFLSEKWIRENVYNIYENSSVQQNQGVLKTGEIEDIWEGEYVEAHEKFTDLLNEFSLAFPIETSDKSSYWIVPKMLSGQRNTWEKKNTDLILKLNFSIDYSDFLLDILPKAKMYFKNVRTIRKLSMIVERQRTKAIIAYSKSLKQIEIRVKGKYQKEFLFIIQSWFANKEPLEFNTEIACTCSECLTTTKKKTFYRVDRLLKKIDNDITYEVCHYKIHEIKNILLGTLLSQSFMKNLNSDNSILEELNSVFITSRVTYDKNVTEIRNNVSRRAYKNTEFIETIKSNKFIEKETKSLISTSKVFVIFLEEKDLKNKQIRNQELLYIDSLKSEKKPKVVVIVSDTFSQILTLHKLEIFEKVTIVPWNENDKKASIENTVEHICSYLHNSSLQKGDSLDDDYYDSVYDDNYDEENTETEQKKEKKIKDWKKVIVDFVTADKILLALDKFPKNRNNFPASTKARYKRLKFDDRDGTITKENFRTELQRIVKAILEEAEDIVNEKLEYNAK